MLSSETEQYKQNSLLLPHDDFSLKLWAVVRDTVSSLVSSQELWGHLFSIFPFSHSPSSSFSLHPSSNIQAFFKNHVAFPFYTLLDILHLLQWKAQKDTCFRIQIAFSLNTKLALNTNRLIKNFAIITLWLEKVSIWIYLSCAKSQLYLPMTSDLLKEICVWNRNLLISLLKYWNPPWNKHFHKSLWWRTP